MANGADELGAAIKSALVQGEPIACELGTFFFVDYPPYLGRNPRTGAAVPVQAKRMPQFLPSEALLTRAAPDEGLREADYRAYLEQDFVGDSSLTDPDVVCDPYDEKMSAHVPAGTRTIAMGALFEELASTLAEKKKVALSGIGTLRLARIARGKLARKRAVRFVPSERLRAALADAIAANAT